MQYNFREEDFALTTDGTGAGSVTSEDLLLGAIWALDFALGTITNSGTITVSAVGGAAGGTDRTLFTLAATLASGLYMPRFATVKSTDTTASGGYDPIAVVNKKIKIAITGGGASKAGSLRLILLK